MALTTVSSRKRKPVDDMDESPPKRQTRSRAAKAAEVSSTTAPKTTRITTASARIAAEAKAKVTKPVIKSTTAARKSRTTDKKTESSSKASEATKSRIRTQKPMEDNRKLEIKTRPRASKTKSAEQSDKLSETRVQKTLADGKNTSPEPALRRTTRARSATMNSEADVDIKPPVVKKVVKRVTFKEDLIDDKENKPLPSIIKKGSASATGIRARPVRQPTKPRSTATVKASSKKIDEKVAPLSPRKITQVAKGASSSEDELSQTPLKKTSKSPTKSVLGMHNANIPAAQISAEKLATDEHETLLASPAKRPPRLPFKDVLQKSPRKFPLPTIMPDLTQVDSSDFVPASLKASPKKLGFTPMKSGSQSGQEFVTTKAALLSSPARRPNSPLKLGSVRLPEKTGAPGSLASTTSIVRQFKNNNLLLATPRKLFGSPSRSASQPEITTKTPELVEGESIEETRVVYDPTIAKSTIQTPFGFRKYSKLVQFGKTDEVFEHDVFEDSGHYRSIDEGSEDELSLGMYTTSPSKSMLLARRLASSPVASSATAKTPLKPLTPKSLAKNQFMTPLAVQFSNWLATSPTRSDSGEGSSTEIYTPVAEVLQNRNIARRGALTPSANPTFFEDQLATVNVTTTPEELMQTQDLHTIEDLQMVDDIPSEAGIIAATPEDLSQQARLASRMDVDMADVDEVEIVNESFEFLHDLPMAGVTPADTLNSTSETPQPGKVELIHDKHEFEDSPLEKLLEQHSADLSDGSMVVIGPNTPHVDAENIKNAAAHTEIQRSPPSSISNAVPIHPGNGALAVDFLPEDTVTDHDTSQDVEEYGDENTVPETEVVVESSGSGVIEDKLLRTPTQAIRTRSKEIRTVARVPLRAASDDSPMQLKVRKGRSKSLSTPLGEIELDDGLLASQDQSIPIIETVAQSLPTNLQAPRSTSQPLKAPVIAEDDLISLAGSPFKSVRKGADAHILRGATVHVDVHTTEGADASSIFIDLLTQMGARCIKQWNWNPRSTLGGGEDLTASSRVGITHVVFKDGSKRTLQKVRETKGLVLCVGVGWVLDCERANRWLDEAPFAVDTSTIPRGGRNRRKSMEPTMLANLAGNLVPVTTPLKSTRKSLRLSKARTSVAPASEEVDETVLLPFTPGKDDTVGIMQPETPAAVLTNTKLIQQTCPPKASQQLLFPLSGNIEDQTDDRIRAKLAKARRQTMGYAPKVASPLSRGFADKE